MRDDLVRKLLLVVELSPGARAIDLYALPGAECLQRLFSRRSGMVSFFRICHKYNMEGVRQVWSGRPLLFAESYYDWVGKNLI